MIPIQRDKDLISNTNLEKLYSLKRFPVFMGCVETDPKDDMFSDMNFYIGKTGMIQLNPILPLEVVYQLEHNPGTTGEAWMFHHFHFSEFIRKYSPTNVFEIGGSHGILSELYYKSNPNIKWTILEPNPIPIDNLKATMIKGFFQSNTIIPENVDMIVHSHVLEHVYEPIQFFKNLNSIRIGMQMCFSIPNLKKHFQKKVNRQTKET